MIGLVKPLFVDVLADGVVIGSAELGPADPSMGVAGGIFRPGVGYDASRHPRETEQRELANAIQLTARTRDGAPVVCVGIDLIDSSETLGDEGREIHVLGMDEFQTYFG